MKQPRDSKGRFLPKPKDGTKVLYIPEGYNLKHGQRLFTEQDILNAFKAGIADSGKGFLLPSKKAELYLRNLK